MTTTVTRPLPRQIAPAGTALEGDCRKVWPTSLRRTARRDNIVTKVPGAADYRTGTHPGSEELLAVWGRPVRA